MLPANASAPAPSGAGADGRPFPGPAIQNQRVTNVTNLISAGASQLAQGLVIDHTYLQENYHSTILDMNLVLHGKLSPREQKWIHRMAHGLALTASVTGITAMVLLSLQVPLTAPLIIAGISTGFGTAGTYLSKGVDLYRKRKNRTVFDANDQLRKLQKKWESFSRELMEKWKLDDNRASTASDQNTSLDSRKLSHHIEPKLKWNEIKALKFYLKKMDDVCALIEQFIIIKSYTKEELLSKFPSNRHGMRSLISHKSSVEQDKCLSTKKIDELVNRLNREYELELDSEQTDFLKNAIICDHSLLKDESILQAKCMDACKSCDKLTSFASQQSKQEQEQILYELLEQISSRFARVQDAFFTAFKQATDNTVPGSTEMIRPSRLQSGHPNQGINPTLALTPVEGFVEEEDYLAEEVYPSGDPTTAEGTLAAAAFSGASGAHSRLTSQGKRTVDYGRPAYRFPTSSYKYSFPMALQAGDLPIRTNGSMTPPASRPALRQTMAHSYAIAAGPYGNGAGLVPDFSNLPRTPTSLQPSFPGQQRPTSTGPKRPIKSSLRRPLGLQDDGPMVGSFPMSPCSASGGQFTGWSGPSIANCPNQVSPEEVQLYLNPARQTPPITGEPGPSNGGGTIMTTTGGEPLTTAESEPVV